MTSSIFDEDPDDLIILGEIQKSVLHFSPVNEMKKKEYCTKLNIQQITPTSDNEGQTCQPIEHPCTIKHVTGDGNCFFRAISFCVSGNENNHLLVRKAIVVHLLKNKNRFGTRVRDGFANVSDYVTKSKVFQKGTWATEMEIMVLANLIETDIYIYDEQNAKWSIFSGKDVQLGVVTSDKGIYLRHTQRIHYDVVLSVQSFHCDNSNEQYIGNENENTLATDAPQYQEKCTNDSDNINIPINGLQTVEAPQKSIHVISVTDESEKKIGSSVAPKVSMLIRQKTSNVCETSERKGMKQTSKTNKVDKAYKQKCHESRTTNDPSQFQKKIRTEYHFNPISYENASPTDKTQSNEHNKTGTKVNLQKTIIAQGTFNQGHPRFGNSSGKQCAYGDNNIHKKTLSLFDCFTDTGTIKDFMPWLMT
ncbi:OTU domain-containing protein 3-like [Strongylocentrotus purpuratus]|uniref:OTU domain-containing protein n=1 Tax=Strongylocentrotus purpuratus TaxID=7668 RepID=A0A7M7PPH3_STRPU|nr:OTU domain-containing protein 3-like [Strongylocentrotus purpuratus]